MGFALLRLYVMPLGVNGSTFSKTFVYVSELKQDHFSFV